MSQGNVLSHTGARFMLPVDTTRAMHEEYEEVIIPPARPVPPRATERLIPVSELDDLAKPCFPGYQTLNRIQSIVYPTAYGSNENMLVCAPTGAGKTDVAMLTVLRVLDQHRSGAKGAPLRSTIDRAKFKIIYVAPMKALAAEIVRKLGKRLQWLGISVRELTGDMQLTKAEIADTQIIVTTPEKWDVVTRKPTGEGELASLLKLLIIDEVHLLNDERGAVIETIVARTLRQVESSQSVIRIVGLSATLPNYVDVAEFLSVSKYKGLFYFDSSFRPVPLEQHFLGIKGKPGSPQSRKNLDTVAFKKVSELVAQGHQVMVFVHSRKDTVKTGMMLSEAALKEGVSDDFLCTEHPMYGRFRGEIGGSRNKEMKQLFDSGFGIHHAGMLRSDRNMMERMFEARAIKVLCCTATLAWGVNLPAHAVFIKGTQVYDSSRGAFVDLSVLDVLQVFGRAGRPGLETSGEGYIATTDDKLQHYLEAVTSQLTTRFARFQKGIVDSLNAEIALGTVANVRDAVQWMGYTYLHVRMQKNPFVYGIPGDVLADDPSLSNKRGELVTAAAQKLANARMIAFDRTTGGFTITDLGRIAAKYYIRHASIEIFNKEFKTKMSEADVLVMLSKSTEFEQVQSRETEIPELVSFKDLIPCDVPGLITITTQDKVNIILQGYVSRLPLDDFALISDSAYVAQNAGRIVRALLEIAVSRKWATVSAVLMGLSKAVEKRLWPFDQPLKQFDLKRDVIHNLERWADDYAPADFVEMSAKEIGELVHLNEIHGNAILTAARQFPTASITYDLKPLGVDVLRIAVRVKRAFDWNARLHGSIEPFWLWVEDHNGETIFQIWHLAFRQTTDVLNVEFVIAIPDGLPPPSVTIRFVSDRWIGAEEEILVPFDDLVMPFPTGSHTQLLPLPYLPLKVVRHPRVEELFAEHIHQFNAIQSQILWSLLNTKWHSLLCAPTAAGKSTMAYILALTAATAKPDAWVLIIAPKKSIAAEITAELKERGQVLGVSVESYAGINVLARPKKPTIKVVLARELLMAMRRHDSRSPLTGLDLVICEGLELLDASYELGVSLLKHATQTVPTRYVGLSASLNDPGDLAAWLDADPAGVHSFRPSDRDQPLSVHTQTFTIPPSAALFKAMAKPAFDAIECAPGEAAIVFVPSRAQMRPVAQDLITYAALAKETDRGFLPLDVSQEILEDRLARLHDHTLADFISRGVGFFHDGVYRTDRVLMLELFAEGVLRVLLVPREAAWALPVRAGSVLVLGTQYARADGGGLADYALPELVRMQGRAVRHRGSGRFHLFCASEAKDTILRFLGDGLPLESELLDQRLLQDWHNERRSRGDLLEKQHIVDALSFTFLARRVATNPVYYGGAPSKRDSNLSRIADSLVDTYFEERRGEASADGPRNEQG
ncbi:Sec63-domain-containing protein [Schizophyllum commune Tattone D]|nr:Sec63-domain-containing protein [Schizophyllum commune Tattone D]